MSVNTNQNKEVLFDVLTSVINENKLVVQLKTLQSLIDNQCNMYEQNKHQFKNLSEINKIILDNIYKYLMDNQSKKKISVVNDNELFNKNNFDSKFEMAKRNFDDMIKLKKPDEISFEDKEEDAMPPENLETIMNQTLADREKELKFITQKYSDENKKKAQDWITKDNPDAKENINLTINETDIQQSSSTPSLKNNKTNKSNLKKVTFKDEVKETNQQDTIQSFSLFNKLKKKPNQKEMNDNSKDILTLEKKLNLILMNQDIIMKQQSDILELLSTPKKETKQKIKSLDLQPL